MYVVLQTSLTGLDSSSCYPDKQLSNLAKLLSESHKVLPKLAHEDINPIHPEPQ